MKRYLPWCVLLLVAVLSVVVSLLLRFQLMENEHWVGACVEQPEQLACLVRSQLGWLIHFKVLACAALGLAVLTFFWPGKWGKVLAGLALMSGLPSLVLYSASLAVFTVVLALLRLVRAPKDVY